MHLLLLGDLIAGARVILAVPPQVRAGVVEKLLAQAHAAHLYQKRFARPHPLWGNGSLMGRANKETQIPEPFADDVDYLAALVVVINITLDHKRQAAAYRNGSQTMQIQHAAGYSAD